MTQAPSLKKPPVSLRGRTSPSPATTFNGMSSFQPQDIWDWPGFKYRFRAVVLLCFNIVLFCGLAFFAFWLRTGHVVTFTYAGYWELWLATFAPGPSTGVTPGTLLEFPINVVQVPMQGVVLGLLLAALVTVPILVAMFYRFVCSIPFLLVMAFWAMMPWLAITLTGSCILASVRPFRFRSRYASGLMGVVPVVVYLTFASLRTGTAIEVMPNPADHIKYLLPWVFALVTACGLLAVGITLGKLVNYRPGAIAPLLAAMFAAPVLLFEFHVGRDELYYRLLESAWKEAFVDQDLSTLADARARHDWLNKTSPRPEFRAPQEQIDLVWKSGPGDPVLASRLALAQLQHSITAQAEWFAKFHPGSAYAVNAYYIEAVTWDTRIDSWALNRDRRIKHYRNFPSEASRHAWQVVLANSPGSAMAAVAMLRLAQLDARAGDIPAGIATLEAVISKFAVNEAESVEANSVPREFLSATHPESTLQVPLEETLLEARQLLELLGSNNDPTHGFKPLIGDAAAPQPSLGLLALDPGDPRYRENLTELMRRYPRSVFQDNFELLLAMNEQDEHRRLEALKRCRRDHPDSDTAAEVLYREAESSSKLDDPAAARSALEALIARFPETPWARSARERLQRLPAGTESQKESP